MKTLNVIASALCLTAVATLTACGGGQPDAQAPDKEEVAEEAMDDMEESIDQVDEQLEEEKDDLGEEG